MGKSNRVLTQTCGLRIWGKCLWGSDIQKEIWLEWRKGQQKLKGVRNSKKRKLHLWGPWGETESRAFKELKEGQLGWYGSVGCSLSSVEGDWGRQMAQRLVSHNKDFMTFSHLPQSVPSPFPCQEWQRLLHTHLTTNPHTKCITSV